jgi:hypothetical protein
VPHPSLARQRRVLRMLEIIVALCVVVGVGSETACELVQACMPLPRAALTRLAWAEAAVQLAEAFGVAALCCAVLFRRALGVEDERAMRARLLATQAAAEMSRRERALKDDYLR